MPETKPEIEELVTGHLALVGHITREVAARMPRHLDTDELLGAGSLALVQAARSFDATLGVPFARFAATRIRGAMIDSMRQRDWASRSVRSRARAIAAAADQLTAVLHRAPTDAELAATAGLTQAEVRAVREGADRASLLTLDPLVDADTGIGATLTDSSPRPDEALVAAERMGYLRDAIAELPERTRHVVVGYYVENRPLTDLAAELAVTQSRASQLRAEGLDLLREALTTLLTEDATAGSGASASGSGSASASADPDGTRARRRSAYVAAVARRSSVRDRADVQTYLDGSALAAARPPGVPLRGDSRAG